MGDYMHIDYIKVQHDQISNFKQNVKSTFVPIQKARIQSGKITNWYLYKVTYPGAQNSYYNYVMITVSDDISSFEDISGQVNGIVSSRERQRLLDNYKGLLISNHSELWKTRNSVKRSDDLDSSRYMVMNYMSVVLGLEYEYQMFEDEIARPIHEQRMEREMMNGWVINELILPGGTEYGYNFSTIDYFDKLEHIEFGFTDELIRQTHPDTNINEFFENIYRTRDLVRSEVWELIEAVN
jgi:hypothetical protein